jgi:protein SCO1/2
MWVQFRARDGKDERDRSDRRLLQAYARAASAVLVFLAPVVLAAAEPSGGPGPGVRTFPVEGVVKSLPDSSTVVVSHQPVAGYMDAMTMPFKAAQPRELAGLQVGDRITFRLLVTDTTSWIDQVKRTGTAPATEKKEAGSSSPAPPPVKRRHPLRSFKFTDELGRAISLDDLRGQALAITFFFTRCPVPDFCPRLSRNFQEASQKLLAQPNAPTNWHFLSVSFDPEFDTPAVLKAYAEGYHYDSRHWSFLTGPADKLAEFAAQSDVTFTRDGGFYNHNFRTLIVNAAGDLQMIFPTSGDLSDALVAEMLKAAAATNSPARGPARR